jgi:hypothetical protein
MNLNMCILKAVKKLNFKTILGNSPLLSIILALALGVPTSVWIFPGNIVLGIIAGIGGIFLGSFFSRIRSDKDLEAEETETKNKTRLRQYRVETRRRIQIMQSENLKITHVPLKKAIDEICIEPLNFTADLREKPEETADNATQIKQHSNTILDLAVRLVELAAGPDIPADDKTFKDLVAYRKNETMNTEINDLLKDLRKFWLQAKDNPHDDFDHEKEKFRSKVLNIERKYKWEQEKKVWEE